MLLWSCCCGAVAAYAVPSGMGRQGTAVVAWCTQVWSWVLGTERVVAKLSCLLIVMMHCRSAITPPT